MLWFYNLTQSIRASKVFTLSNILYYLMLVVLFIPSSIYSQIDTERKKVIQSGEVINSKLADSKYYFIENKGQWPLEVLFMAEGKSLRTWVTNKSMVFEQFDVPKNDSKNLNDRMEKKGIKAYALALEFISPQEVNANFSTPSNVNYNYLIGNDKSKHKTGVQKFKEVIVQNIYKGIDMRYYFEDGNIRYDYIVQPYADPAQIELEIKGSQETVLENGSLEMKTSLKPIIKQGLYAYQRKSDSSKQTVNSNFVLNGNRLKLHIGDYDKSKILIIDPLIVSNSNTLYNPNGDELITNLKVDTNGDILFCGYANTPDFTDFDVDYGQYVSNYDIIIGKMDSDLNLLWTTFCGGIGDDYSKSIEVDNNNIYFNGSTMSYNFPLSTQRLFSNLITFDNDEIYTTTLTVLNLNGNGIKYSTFLDITPLVQDFFYNTMKLSNQGILYLVGNVYDTQIPTFIQRNSINTQTRAYNAMTSAIIALESSSIGDFHFDYKFSSLFGGNFNTHITAINLDSQENIYIAGLTRSTPIDFDIKPIGSYQKTINGVFIPEVYSMNMFVAKLHFNSILEIDYNTYWGKRELFNGEILDIICENNKIYFAGTVYKDNIIEFRNAYRTSQQSWWEAFLAVIEPIGNGNSDLLYSSLFSDKSLNGATLPNWIFKLNYDDLCNQVIFCGYTNYPLLNYVHHDMINDNFGIAPQMMVGTVDISKVGINTLTNLGYADNAGFTVDYNQSTDIIYAGGDNLLYENGTTNSNMIINKFNKESCNQFNPPQCCPWNINDSWLIINNEKGGGNCGPDQCWIAHIFNIPLQYSNCYYSIIISQWINGERINLETFASIDDIVMSSFDLCIGAGQNYEIRIAMYMEQSENPCLIYRSLHCTPCNCDINLLEQLVNFETEVEGCNDNECSVNVDIDLDNNYLKNCFTHFTFSTSIDGVEIENQLSPVVLTDFLNPLIKNRLNRCVLPGTNYSVTINFMRSSTDEELCSVTKNYECPCPCPFDEAEVQSWFEVTVTPGTPLSECDENHCQVNAILNIPGIINCYNYYKIGETGTLFEIPSNSLPLPQRNLLQGAYSSLSCIEKGTFTPIVISLYKNLGDTDPCILNNFAYCPNDTVLVPCTPSPCQVPETPWKPDETKQFPYPGCPNCIYEVTYRYRTNICLNNSTQDLQILSLKLIGDDCRFCSISIQALQEEAIKKLIFVNSMQFDPKTGSSTGICNDTWRVIMASCWAEYSLPYIIAQKSNGGNVVVFSPCNGSECCMVGMRVCKYTDPDRITIMPLSPIGNNSICSTLTKTVINPASFGIPHYDATTGMITNYTTMTINCDDRCNDLFSIEDNDYRGKISLNDFEISSNNYKSDDLEISSNYYDDILHTQVKCNTNCSDLIIRIFSLQGHILFEQNFSISKGINLINSDLNKFKTGLYFIRYSSGNSFHSADKIIIVK